MMGFTERVKEAIKRYEGKKHPVDKIAYKLKAYDLADRLGIKHAKIYGIYSRIEFVSWKKLPGQFVIKPQQGCSTHGVMPLIKIEEKENPEFETYFDILRNKLMPKERIIAYFMEGLLPESHVKHSRGLWIEELLGNPVPCDWKVYTFNGKIGFIRQYKGDGEIKYSKNWTEGWEITNPIMKEMGKYIINNKLPAPIHKEELLETAKRLSIEVKHPFVRVDLYDTPNGIYLGELTPHPGSTHIFIDSWQNDMGKLWEKAERELNDKREKLKW